MPSQSNVFTIRIIITNTTDQITIRGHFTTDVFHQEIAFPLRSDSNMDPMIYVFSVAGAAVIGCGEYYGLKKRKRAR